MNRTTRLLVLLALLTLLVLGSLTVYHFRSAPEPAPAPAPADTRDGRWRQDLRYLAEELPRLHGNLFFTLEREDFEAAVGDLDAAVPLLTDDEIAVRLARIVAMADDAHTRVLLGSKRLPVSLYWFQDGIFVVAAHPDFTAALRRKLVRIGWTGSEAAVRRATRLVPAEGNPGWVRLRVPDLLVCTDVLHGLGIIPSADTARFALADRAGAIEKLDFRPIEAGESFEWSSAVEGPVPEYRKKRDQNYWFAFWPDSKTLYFQYNSCAEMPDKPFAGFCDELFAVADREQPERLVVDLRTNGGGNSGVLAPFLAGLRARPALDRKDRVFVLVGRRTFSSACGHALEFSRSGKATLVGEPTGGNPYSPFRESIRLELPNSKLAVSLTWKFVGRGGEGDAVMPDVRVDTTSEEYFSGRDPVLEAALGHAPK